MTERQFTTVRTRTVADLKFISVQLRDVLTPSGSSVERAVVTHPGAVAVVPIIDGDIIMIEQYRVAVDRYVLEIPAGKLDGPDERRIDTAHRELEEETGLLASNMTKLVDLLTSVGFSDEVITVYLGEGLSQGDRAPVGDEEVEARIVRMPFQSAIDAVHSGEITDAKSIAGILLAAQRVAP
ncbi:MAG: NUDIX hydrolase [Acidimicrobiia bacterium]